MAATPYPTNLFHVGSARPLTLAVPFTADATGDLTLYVNGSTSEHGWPLIPTGQKMVVTVGRGTDAEHKQLVSSVTNGTSQSVLTVLEADRNYDGTLPINCDAGTTVEHTVSATEMATINTHMRTKLAHGSDGDLVDENSAQTLSNKTLANLQGALALGNDVDLQIGEGAVPRSVISNGGVTSFILTPSDANGSLQTNDRFYYHASGAYYQLEAPLNMGGDKIVNVADGTGSKDAVNFGQLGTALPKAGGTMSGNIAMGNHQITGLKSSSAGDHAIASRQVQGGYVTIPGFPASSVWVTFPTAYGGIPVVTATRVHTVADEYAPAVSSVSQTGFYLNGIANYTYTWIAIGS